MKPLTDDDFLNLRRAAFNTSPQESGELTCVRSFVVESVLGRRTGSTYNYTYVRDTEGAVWELPLCYEALAVPGNQILARMTRAIRLEEMHTDFEILGPVDNKKSRRKH